MKIIILVFLTVLLMLFSLLMQSNPYLSIAVVLTIGVFWIGLNTIIKRNAYIFLYTTVALFPVIIPIGSINEMPLIALLSPALLIIVFLSKTARIQVARFHDSMIYNYALAILVLCAIIGLVRNPSWVELSHLSIKSKVGIKNYIYLFTGCCIYLFNVFYFQKNTVDSKRLIYFIYYISIGLGFLRLILYFIGMNIPFIGEEFRYSEAMQTRLWNRIGGIDRCALLALPAAIALFGHRRRIVVYLLLILALIVSGGGRTALAAFIVSIFIYTFMLNRKFYGRFMIIIMLIAGASAISYGSLKSFGQFHRLSQVGKLIHEDINRTTVYRYYWDIFINNPIFGKGISPYVGYFTSPSQKFTEMQLEGGGHGAYISILAVFGLGGAIFILIFVFRAMIQSYFLYKRSKAENQLFLFICVYMIILCVRYLSSGNGYTDLSMYYMVGLMVGTVIKTKKYLDLKYKQTDTVC